MKVFVSIMGLLGLLLAPVSSGAESWTVATRANNIHCDVGDDPQNGSLMCVIFRHSGPLAQPKPADCTKAWGQSYFIRERGKVQMLCLEKQRAEWSGNDKFEREKEMDFGGIICRATRNTVKCTNRDGHGFELSRKQQSVF